jgi:hypothetical protein
MNFFPITVQVPDPGADNKQLFVFQAPTDGLGGGVRLLAADAVNGATLAGAGTTFTYQLLKYSSAATPAVNGTISDVIGSATQWTASTPQAFTLDSDYTFLDAGEWLVVDYQELAAANPTNSQIVIWAQLGN